MVLDSARPAAQARPRARQAHRPATIDRRLSGVVVTARRAEDVAEEARALLKAKVKEMEKTGQTRGRSPAPALLVRHMEKIAPTLPRNRAGIRDLSLMTLHFALAGREHELAWLRLRDVLEDPEGRGLIGDVRVSKIAPRVVEVPFGSRAHLRPVRAWRRWRQELGPDADPDSFASRRLRNRWYTVLAAGLDPESVGDVLPRIAARAGLEIRPTGHSPRRGPGHRVLPGRLPGRRGGEAGRLGPRLQGDARLPRGRRRFRENALHGVLQGLTGRTGSCPRAPPTPHRGLTRSTLSCSDRGGQVGRSGHEWHSDQRLRVTRTGVKNARRRAMVGAPQPLPSLI
ncbi:hypothetical protein [Streptomyces ochraceiscleroticus]|uniref:Tyr recombinase domain-containing protein n=1 Tax=Streptomyces ochraceiscleroticus TaxID=47761 RepID=A0ABW1MMX5_9ACTN|nr:hypothetical protein [Streptomyces ochraceiscleroticus]